MEFNLSQLPDDAHLLKQMVLQPAAEKRELEKDTQLKTLTIEQLKAQIARLRRLHYGKSSEKIASKINGEIEQLELQLDELQTETAQAEAKLPDAWEYQESCARGRFHFQAWNLSPKDDSELGPRFEPCLWRCFPLAACAVQNQIQ